MPSEKEQKLRVEADRRGIALEELLNELIDEHLNRDSVEEMKARLRAWREQESVAMSKSFSKTKGRVSVKGLFEAWAEEDAQLTEEETEEETRFWSEFQTAINSEREGSQMRKLF